MPIYEYKCLKCGKVFEAIQKVTQKSLPRCKFCKGQVEQLISSSSFQLKGTGWYKTDYASKSGGSEKSSESGDKSGEKSGEKSGDKKGDKEESSKKPESPDKGKSKKES